MIWRRYRTAALWAVPTGVGIGCLLAIALYLTGNPDFRAQGGIAAFAGLVMSGAAIGGACALVATLGAAAGLAVRDPAARRSPASRVRAGWLGAGLAVALSGLGVGFVDAIVTSAGGSWFGVWAVSAVVAGVIAALAAALLLSRAEHASAREHAEPARSVSGNQGRPQELG